jgi:hypothetical protein
MAEQKIYLKGCSAKAKQFDNGGQIIKLGFKVDDLAEFCRKHKNDRGYLNLVVAERREEGQYGDTHSVYLDTYTPRTGAGARQDADAFAGRHSEPVTSDDIPF